MQHRRVRKCDFYVGEHARFLVKLNDGIYRVYDAHGVTDAELREGKRSPCVFECRDVKDAVAYCEAEECKSTEYT